MFRPAIAIACSLSLSWCSLVAGETAFLVERPQIGNTYHVSVRTDLSGSLTPPTQKAQPAQLITLRGESVFDYDERILEVGTDGLPSKTVRSCQQMRVERTVAGQAQKNILRDSVRRLVILRDGTTKAPFSPDGPLTWMEIDLVRNDVFAPLLAGLLPQKEVRRGDHWVVSSTTSLELSGLERIEKGTIECSVVQINTAPDGGQVRVKLSGTIEGANEDGPSRQVLDGYFLYDLQVKQVSYLYIQGKHSLLDGERREMGKIEGRFALSREPRPKAQDLTDDALRGVDLVPSARNTLLLYDNADLGVRFVHPRRWRIGTAAGRQITMEAPEGAGLLITLEPPDRMPTTREFLHESRGWLGKQQAKIRSVSSTRRVQDSPGVEAFSIAIELKGQPVVMDYYVTRQELGGAVLAARLPGQMAAALATEVAELARSLRITARPAGE